MQHVSAMRRWRTTRRSPQWRTRYGVLALLVVMCCCFGCFHHSKEMFASLPDRYKVDLGQLQVRSDIDIADDDPLLDELRQLKREITSKLELPAPHRSVVVHLFADAERYSAYMQKNHPNLPTRRAFFIGSPTELAVYAHWSPNVGEDLRHEYTHGILHASLKTVPLWLDEGLAEYFEIQASDLQRRHPEHTPRLALALKNGWRPDLARLEQIETVDAMQRADYQESWAWIHYLLHEAPDGRMLLIDYCKSLQKSDKPPRFADQLAAHFPDPEIRLASYISLSLSESH